MNGLRLDRHHPVTSQHNVARRRHDHIVVVQQKRLARPLRRSLKAKKLQRGSAEAERSRSAVWAGRRHHNRPAASASPRDRFGIVPPAAATTPKRCSAPCPNTPPTRSPASLPYAGSGPAPLKSSPLSSRRSPRLSRQRSARPTVPARPVGALAPTGALRLRSRGRLPVAPRSCRQHAPLRATPTTPNMIVCRRFPIPRSQLHRQPSRRGRGPRQRCLGSGSPPARCSAARPPAHPAPRLAQIRRQAQPQVDRSRSAARSTYRVNHEENLVPLQRVDELHQRPVVAAQAGIDAHLGQLTRRSPPTRVLTCNPPAVSRTCAPWSARLVPATSE